MCHQSEEADQFNIGVPLEILQVRSKEGIAETLVQLNLCIADLADLLNNATFQHDL